MLANYIPWLPYLCCMQLFEDHHHSLLCLPGLLQVKCYCEDRCQYEAHLLNISAIVIVQIKQSR